MAVNLLSPKNLRNFLRSTGAFLKMPGRRYWIDYDQEADVLYIGFRKPQHATESELRDDGVIVRKRGDELVGITVLNASRRKLA